ncbi:hypothetical protein FORC22_4766 (plasmid) [Vibrio parahaemolyticus]|nr:hypothetical protein FORC22_4766 [Vibrio parahaemolyticus]
MLHKPSALLVFYTSTVVTLDVDISVFLPVASTRNNVCSPWIKNSISTKLQAGSVHKNHNYYIDNVLELYRPLSTSIA